MSYMPGTISVFLNNRLNKNHFLPAIQREFVWSQDKIIRLFDSIMRDYPIGSFLFWEIKSENRDKWDVYKFVENYKLGLTHNEPTETNNVPQLTLVLDGQQRLTSLLIALNGSYAIKKKGGHSTNPNSWEKQYLYINLLKEPMRAENDSDTGLYYEFAFLKKDPINSDEKYWFRVGEILHYDNEDEFDNFVSAEEDKLTKRDGVFRKNIHRLYRKIWKDENLSFYTVHDQDYNKVLDIFIRANDGGVKLSKSDLLLSMVTAKWGEVNARDAIHDFVDDLNNNLTRKNNFDKDFVMKACLVLSDLPVRYKVENFSNANLQKIYAEWEDTKNAIKSGVNLINTFGIDRENLTSANALIPIIYYLKQNDGLNLLDGAATEVENAAKVRKWLLSALLNNVFGGQSDRVLQTARDVLKNNSSKHDFPLTALNTALGKLNRKTVFDEDTISNFLELKYGRQLTFLALTLLYEERNWGTIQHQKDHIFPQTFFENLGNKGIPQDKHASYIELRDRIGNLELLTSSENNEKRAKELLWLDTRSPEFRKKHLIPLDNSLLTFDKFEEFIAAREKLISSRLKELFAFNTREPQTMGN